MAQQLKLLLLGCGDIATRLAAQLAPQDYDITGLRRSPVPAAFTVLAGDATSVHDMSGLMAVGFDAIVVTITPDQRSEAGYRNSYLKTMLVLLDSLAAVGSQPFVVFVSSTRVYGQNNAEWVDEQSPTQPGSFAGQVLLETEQLLRNSQLVHSVVRFSGIYGPGRNAQLQAVHNKRPLKQPTGWTNRIHSDDCAAVLAHLLEKHRTGDNVAPLYLASDNQPLMQWQLRAFLSRQLGLEGSVATDLETLTRASGKRCRNDLLNASGYRWCYESYQTGYQALIRQQCNRPQKINPN